MMGTMKNVLANSSVVVLAKDINLSIFKPSWLVKSEIFREGELEGEIVITPVTVQIPTERFQVAIFPDRIQMNFARLYDEAELDIARILGGIVTTLPHTPYTAAGLNFTYFTAPESKNGFGSWNRKLFASRYANQVRPPECKDVRFGSYLSYDIIETRLSINVRPISAPLKISDLCASWHTDQHLMKLNFNFQRDIDESLSAKDILLELFTKWPDALALSEDITHMITDGD